MLAFEENEIPAPVTKETLLDDPLREKFVAAGIVGPEIVITCKDCESVILLPPTKVTAPEVIELVAPAVLPDVPITIALCTVPLFAAEIVIVLAFELRVILFPATREALPVEPFNVNAPPPAEAPRIVILGLVEFWLRVILLPATRANAVEDAVFTVPEVAPPAAEVIVVRTDPPDPPPALIMIVPTPVVSVTLLPPDKTMIPEEPEYPAACTRFPPIMARF